MRAIRTTKQEGKGGRFTVILHSLFSVARRPKWHSLYAALDTRVPSTPIASSGQGAPLRGRNKARNPSLTARPPADALPALLPRGLSGLCHAVHPAGGQHGSKKLQIAHLLIDSKRVYACSSQMLSHHQ